MNLAQAENAVKLRLSRFYRNLEVSVSLKELRTIQVTVGGEAYAPGGYVVPAITGVFNLLYAAGGPTEEGSLRRIEVIRHGKTIGTLDFYKFLMTGEQGEIPLQTGDIIYIPPSQSRITVRGEVRFQAIFEINEKENLADILRYAGGVKASGVQQLVQVTTIDPGNSRILKNIPLKEAVQSKLYDEDVVTIFSLRPLVTNRVTIEGAVDQPNDYALSAGMRVADLVELARGTIAEAYPFRAELYRWNSDNSTTLTVIDLEKAMARNPEANLPLQRWDRLKVYTMEDVAWAGIRKVEVRGAVTKPGYYEYSRNMHISDLLRKVGGPLPDATLVVLLHQRGDGTYKYEYSRVAEISASNTAKDSLIEDNDLLAVYRTGEDQFTPDHNVLIRGEVISPGLYKRAEGMKLSNLLQLCGGFTPKAGSSVVLAHARKPVDGITADWKTQTVEFDSQHRATNDLVLEDGDVIIVQGTGGFQDKPAIITVNGAVRKPGPIILESKNMRLSDAIAKAGGLRPEAFTAGAEFIREPQNLTSTGQRDLAGIINDLNNLLNESDYKRENAKAEVDRIKAGLGSSPSALSDISNGAKNPATAVAIASQLSTHNLVTPPRVLKDKDLEPNGNIAINLTNALNKPKGSDDLILLDGDIINIRAKPTTVQVIGGVINPRGVLFKPGERLEYYIDATGGFAPDAAKDRLVVIRPGGGLIPIKRLQEFNAGDLILVPTKVLAAKISNNTNLLDSVFRGITSSAILYRLATGIFGL